MKKIVYSTQSYKYLAESVTYGIGGELGVLKFEEYSDGEMYHRIDTDVRGRDVVLIGGTISSKERCELFDMGCGLVAEKALSLTIVVPFLGYSTMERAVKDGEIVTAKTNAIMLSAIPKAPMGNTIVMIDLHTEGLPYYFAPDIFTKHLYGKDIVAHAAKELYGDDFVFASTDLGRAKWVRSLAKDMRVRSAFIGKDRLSGSETEVMYVGGSSVKDKNVIIYDDMIRTGGSLIEAADAYLKNGAKEISVIATHGLFTNNGLDRIAKSGKIKHIICTDTHPNAVDTKNKYGWLNVLSVDRLISNYLNS